MAINFTRLFTSEGLLCGALNETNTFRGTVDTRKTTLATQYSTLAPYAPLVSELVTIRDSEKQAQDSYLSSLGNHASEIIINETDADRALTDKTLSGALAELVRQMGVSAQTLVECPSTVTAATISASGDVTLATGRYEGLTGRISDFMVPDVYLVQCTSDRSTGATQYQETFSVVGKPADSLPTDSAYPNGTGINTSITVVDPGANSGSITDGYFPNWSTNTPASPWTLGSGVVAGTHVLKSTDTPRSSGFSCNLVGDGTVFPRLKQAVTLTANTAYNVTFRVKKVADPGTDWMVSVRLVDGSGTAVAGNGSYSNLISSATAASVAADWTNVVTGQFCTPAVIPASGLYFELVMTQNGSITTAPVSGASAYVTFISVIEATALYSGGFAPTLFSGITESHVGDAFTWTVALSSGAMSSYLIRGIDRLLKGGLASATVRIPTTTSGAATISNSLVT